MGTSSVMKLWHIGFIALCALIVAASCLFYKNGSDIKKEETSDKISVKKWVYWVVLSALGTILLASYTTYVSVEMLPLPLIWSLFLGVYLLTFVLCFGSEKYYNRNVYKIAIPIALLAFGFVYDESLIRLSNSMVLCCLLLFVIFFLFLMVLNGEIYKTRPASSKLSEFYLAIAFGGVLGGFFVNIIAPLIFNRYLELPLANTVVVLFVAYLTIKDFLKNEASKPKVSLKIAGVFLVLVLTTFVYLPLTLNLLFDTNIRQRNFYGVLTLMYGARESALKVSNGNTLHGKEIYNQETKKFDNTPLTYYSELSAFDFVYGGMKNLRV